MNPNYNQTITIYNCFKAADNPDSTRDIWQKTVLVDCFYKNVVGQVYSGVVENSSAGHGMKMSNAYTVRIPESDRYRPYSEWVKLPEMEREKYFTCSVNDVVVKGECEEEITGTSPNTASQLLSKHKPEAFLVTAFSDNTSSSHAKHYRLGG